MCDCPLSETELRVVRWLSDGKDCQDIALGPRQSASSARAKRSAWKGFKHEDHS